MTFKTDLAAIVPTAAAKAAFLAKGANISQLIQTLLTQATEMQHQLKQVISLHPNDGVVSATVNAGGSGGTNGPVTITGTTGAGTKFTARGNISGGALTGALTIITSGNYSVDLRSTIRSLILVNEYLEYELETKVSKGYMRGMRHGRFDTDSG
jgi:hypothetical protein